MASITGVELKPDSCLLAAIRPAPNGVDVSALHVIPPLDWPGQDLALADALRSVRIGKRMPRRARVVIWGLPELGSADDPATLALLRPFTMAGFKIQAVVTPPQALTALAGRRSRETGAGAVAWLTLNTHGTAIAIVRGGELLYSRTFDWLYTPGEAGSTAQLLQRYTLVAHLAPELRYGMSMVHSAHGVTVDTAVTCGDLPDLRSLTMPLIEELDLEVETLDSTDGLRPVGRAKQERFAELAPAMRLACATAMIEPSQARAERVIRRWIPIAATAALIGGGVGYVYWSAPAAEAPPSAVAARPSTSNGRSQPNRAAEPIQQTTSAAVRTAQAPVPTPEQQTASRGVSRGSGPPVTGPGGPPAPALPSASQPPATQAPRSNAAAPPSAGAVSSPIVLMRQAPSPAQQTEPAADKPDARVPTTLPPTLAASPPQTVAVPPIAAPPVVGWSRGPVSRRTPGAQALKEALPKVDSILIDRERRLAIIDGTILAVGDAVGSRTIVQIEKDAVILREPSGLEIRVRLRSFSSGGVI